MNATAPPLATRWHAARCYAHAAVHLSSTGQTQAAQPHFSRQCSVLSLSPFRSSPPPFLLAIPRPRLRVGRRGSRPLPLVSHPRSTSRAPGVPLRSARCARALGSGDLGGCWLLGPGEGAEEEGAAWVVRPAKASSSAVV